MSAATSQRSLRLGGGAFDVPEVMEVPSFVRVGLLVGEQDLLLDACKADMAPRCCCVRNITGMLPLSCVSWSRGEWEWVAETLRNVLLMLRPMLVSRRLNAGPQGDGAQGLSGHFRPGTDHPPHII